MKATSESSSNLGSPISMRDVLIRVWDQGYQIPHFRRSRFRPDGITFRITIACRQFPYSAAFTTNINWKKSRLEKFRMSYLRSTAKDQEDHPKKREDCVQHEAESVSASSLKINRFRNRWNSGEAQVHGCKQLGMKSGSTFAQALARGQFIRAIKGEVRNAIEIREAIEGSATQRVKHEVVD